MTVSDNDAVRLDKWLWAARFFRTRSLARAAVDAGHVRYDGERSKPGKVVRVGAKLHIRQGYSEIDVTVLATSGRRGSAPVARTLYVEDVGSIARREAEAAQRKLAAASRETPAIRPDKKQRRALQRLKGRD